jgi:hypothetical protein
MGMGVWFKAVDVGAPGRSITPSAVRTTPPRGETQRMPPSNLVAVPQGRQRIESFTVL